MGAMEGTYCPTSFTAVAAASKPQRRGFNQGLQQSGFALLGFALGPIIATQLLNVVPSWRWVFWIVAIPGFIVGVLLFFVLREPKDTQAGALIGATQSERCVARSAEGAEHRRVHARVAVRDGVRVRARRDGADLSRKRAAAHPGQMGVVTSALGFGGFFGQFGWPGLSDRFGRKPLAILGFVGATIAVWWFANTGADVVPLFVALFVCSFFCLGNVALITGPIATESAPRGLISSAIGVVVGAGEIFGGGVAPYIAGNVADRVRLAERAQRRAHRRRARHRRCLFLRETAPSKTAPRRSSCR